MALAALIAAFGFSPLAIAAEFAAPDSSDALRSSNFQWQSGDLPSARSTIERALKTSLTADLAHQQALLLEASGDLIKAQAWYKKALDLSTDPKQQAQLRLRLTFISLAQQDVQQLVILAQGKDREFRNRAAIALAVLGHYEEATKLYAIFGDAAARFRQHLRLAQWALQANNAGVAKEEAWQAVQLATVERDRRYGLSVLVEAHRSDNTLDGLLRRFAGKQQLTPEEQDVRIELLRELGRYDEAIALFTKAGASALTAEVRRQLLRMYGDAGRDADMVVEYRKLIASEPDEVAWPEGLSQHLIEHGDSAAAREVWREFIERTRKPAVLLAGARAMSRFGLDELAVRATDKCVELDSARVVDARLFQFELFRGRGDSDRAGKVLAELDRTLPPDDAHRIELSYAFERIKQPKQALAVMDALGRHKAGGLDREEQMRIAWLYDNTGQRDQALATWKKLWEAAPSDASRRMVEDRLVVLAAETGALGDLVVELETRLAAGKASRKDAALLIRIYTDAQDPASAVEVIEEYFGATGGNRAADIASLKEQARVYRALGEGNAFRSVTTRLLALDPENKRDYLQGLILNRVESASAAAQDADARQLRQWLDELRKATAGAGVEFEAGVLVLAGLDAQAIEAYRRALATNPNDHDNYLLWADLLKKNSRTGEAIAGLQYLVEHATQDDAFVVGIDGLLNMQSRDPEIIRWAQRRVLERLTAHDDKLYLYDLLAELAEEARDTAVYFAALENSLTYADSRRSNVLRELIGASSEEGRGQFRDPDVQRRLRYSRRLVALGENLPPDVYMDMGKAFLRGGAEDSAARAFNLAFDRTGQTSLIEKAGDLFRSAGYSRQAGEQYEKALIGDAGNFGIMGKLADTRMAQGRLEEAHGLYLKAMLGLLNSQPIQADSQVTNANADLSSTTTFAYRENYRPLLAGVLATLPMRGEPSLATVREAFDQALQEAADSAREKGVDNLAAYPRLKVLSLFARALGWRTARYEYADKLDARLLEHFGKDSSLVAEITRQRLAWGLTASAARLAPPDKVAAEAARLEIPEQSIAAALLRADQDRALSVYRTWFKTMVMPNAVSDDERGQRRSTADIVIHAREHLDSSHYAAFCRFVFDLLRGHPEYAVDLIYGAGRGFVDARATDSILLHLEQTVGAELFAEAQLRRVIDSKPRTAGGELDGVYVTSRLSPQRQVEDVKRQLSGDAEGRVNAGSALATLEIILSRPLSEQTSAQLDQVFKERLLQIKIDREFELAGIIDLLSDTHLARRIHRGNVGLLESWDDYLARTYPERASPGVLKINLLRDLGRAREAVPFVIDTALLRYAKPESGPLQANVAVVDGDQPSADELGRAAMSRYLLSMQDLLYPDHRQDVLALAEQKERELGLTPAVLALKTLLRQFDPEQDFRRTAAVAEDTATATLAPASSMQTSSPGPVGVMMGAAGAAPFDDPLFGAPVIKQALQKIFAVDGGASVNEARAALRNLWRLTLVWNKDLIPAPIQFGMGGGAVQLEYAWLFDLNWGPGITRSNGAGTFFEKLSQHDFAVVELEAQLHALSPNAIDEQYSLYSLLAAAYERTNRLSAELQRLTADLEAGRASSKELVLLLELMARLPIAQLRERLPFAQRKIAELGIASGYQSVLMARFHAATGNDEKAVAAYQQAFIARVSGLRFPGGSSALFTADGLYADARTRLNAVALDSLLTGLLRLTVPDDSAEQRAAYARFIMGLLEQDLRSTVARAQFASLLKSGAALQTPADQVRAVRLQARLGHFPAALERLKAVLKRSIERPGVSFAGFSIRRNAQQSSLSFKAEQYASLLAFHRDPRSQPDTDRALLQGLFSIEELPWPDEPEWAAQVTAAVRSWIEHGEVDPNAAAAALSAAAEHSIPQP